jgi:hypothetical protein
VFVLRGDGAEDGAVLEDGPSPILDVDVSATLAELGLVADRYVVVDAQAAVAEAAFETAGVEVFWAPSEATAVAARPARRLLADGALDADGAAALEAHLSEVEARLRLALRAVVRSGDVPPTGELRVAVSLDLAVTGRPPE